jgi:hypothetical protein
MKDTAFQCTNLNNFVATESQKLIGVRTYHKRLVKSKHYNELDGQKLCKRAATLQFFCCQAIKHKKAIQRDASDWKRWRKLEFMDKLHQPDAREDD